MYLKSNRIVPIKEEEIFFISQLVQNKRGGSGERWGEKKYFFTFSKFLLDS